jgi:hypothetical protein
MTDMSGVSQDPYGYQSPELASFTRTTSTGTLIAPRPRQSGAARGLLAQLAEQHDTVQDTIIENWVKFARDVEGNDAAATAPPSSTERVTEPTTTMTIKLKANATCDTVVGTSETAHANAEQGYVVPSEKDAEMRKMISDATAATIDGTQPTLAPALGSPSLQYQQQQYMMLSTITEGSLARRVQNMNKEGRKVLQQLIRSGVPAQLR